MNFEIISESTEEESSDVNATWIEAYETSKERSAPIRSLYQQL